MGWEDMIMMGSRISLLTSLVRKVEFFSSVCAQYSFGYQITSCFITQWLGNMRAVLSTCHAVPSLVNALK